MGAAILQLRCLSAKGGRGSKTALSCRPDVTAGIFGQVVACWCLDWRPVILADREVRYLE